jgi:hypothetical protein
VNQLYELLISISLWKASAEKDGTKSTCAEATIYLEQGVEWLGVKDSLIFMRKRK